MDAVRAELTGTLSADAIDHPSQVEIVNEGFTQR